jgi:hypothetical protein
VCVCVCVCVLICLCVLSVRGEMPDLFVFG